MGDSRNVNLPPGFRFYPTDEELVVHFLQRKAALLPCHPDVIPDLELYPYDPWELDGKALGEGKQWYFYSRRTQNRSTGNGYWKAMGIDEPVVKSNSSKKVGMKKYFVFYIGESGPAGIKTNWTMKSIVSPIPMPAAVDPPNVEDIPKSIIANGLFVEYTKEIVVKKKRMEQNCRAWMKCSYHWMTWMI
ncbi:NAC domain-containing protein 68 [Hibiscus syriacus]|uniref:NAC domain-containing protein 68 n=1 Tax=Hibiscus syriacus TaxID=106335 RepID=A0A6A3BYL8_HIBSY|nr:NAC domain-containing protein 68 [Hibiscus syriacus]